MPRTASERVVAAAVDALQDGDLRRCIRLLVEFAATHMRNRTTAEAFEPAVDAELAAIQDDVSAPDDSAPRCRHCSSTSTYVCADGPAACNNCPGIMPRTEVDGR